MKAAAIGSLSSSLNPSPCKNQTITGAIRNDIPECTVFRRAEETAKNQNDEVLIASLAV
jgi:hypothetical protein